MSVQRWTRHFTTGGCQNAGNISYKFVIPGPESNDPRNRTEHSGIPFKKPDARLWILEVGDGWGLPLMCTAITGTIYLSTI